MSSCFRTCGPRVNDTLSPGFSWIELLIGLALSGVLAVLAAPSLVHLMEVSHARFLCERLGQTIEDTRLLAMATHRKLVVCGSDGRGKCSPVWEAGWSQKTFGGRLLQHWPLEGEQGRLHYRFFPRGRSMLVFLPNGWPEIENGTFWYCPKHWKFPAFALRLNRFGSIRVEQPVTKRVAQEDGLDCI